MSVLTNKIDFKVIFSVDNANPNGDPLDENRPRTDYNGYGIITDGCIKRKIRNRMQDMGLPIFVQMEERKLDDCKSLNERTKKNLGKIKNRNEFEKKACEMWLDARAFGQVFAFDSLDVEGKSAHLRGPVTVRLTFSVAPVEIQDMQITKSVNGNSSEKKASDTYGHKYFVKHGIYVINGSINVQLAEKTGFSEEDADVVKECLRTLFVNDASAARPDGSMEVLRVYWWKHNCKDGQYSSARVHRSVKISVKDGIMLPASIDDYDITETQLDGLVPEIIDGV